MAISIAVKSLNTMHHDSMSVNFVRFVHTLGVQLANDGLIEIVYQCRKQKEYSVL